MNINSYERFQNEHERISYLSSILATNSAKVFTSVLSIIYKWDKRPTSQSIIYGRNQVRSHDKGEPKEPVVKEN